MKKAIILGAGFSRNWGGWLASEVYDFLLSCPELQSDTYLKEILERHNANFESALEIIQNESSQGIEQQARLSKLQSAIKEMFDTMDQAFLAKSRLDFARNGYYVVEKFLKKFDIIFTLNQDLLLERCYRTSLNQIRFQGPTQWHHHYLPGVNCLDNLHDPNITHSKTPLRYVPQSDTKFELHPDEHLKFQPIIKLHGSSNWYHNSSTEQLLIMGGNKEGAILASALLKWYQEILKECLKERDTKLMIIGYSFSDIHINSIIIEAVKINNLKLFIIDPNGLNIIKNKFLDQPEQDAIKNAVVGISKRRLEETFKDANSVEYSKINRFFK